MKNKKVLSVISAVVWVSQLIVEILTVLILLQLDMLPTKIVIALSAVFLLLWGITGALMFFRGRKRKQPVSGARRVIALILAVAVAICCAGLSSVAMDLHQTMTTVSNKRDMTTLMNVYVCKEDPAQTLQDAAGYRFGIVDGYDAARAEQAVDEIQQELGKKITTSPYVVTTQMVDALYDGQVGAIILNSAYVSVLESHEAYADFSHKTRVLYQVRVVEQTGNPAAPGGSDTVPQNGADVPGAGGKVQVKDITTTPFVVYISGSDTRSEMLTTSNSDVNILVVVNPVTKQVLLINTPRDYYIPNPACGGALDKLTHCGCYGIDTSIQALSDLYSEKIHYYAQINFTGFETLIDAVGGVTVYSDVSFTARDTYVQVGENYFTGSQALDFTRERYSLAGGDNDRGKNQMKVIKALIQKLASGAAITNYSVILDSLEGMFLTDMPMSDISKLVKMQLSDMAAWNVQSYAVTGNCGSEITCSMPGVSLSVMYCDQGMVDFGTGLIDRVVAGDILTDADVVYPGE